MAQAKKERLDQLMVSRGLVESRSQAQALIMAGRVSVSGTRVDKAGRAVDPTEPIDVEALPRFVSRGGEKLLAAIEGLSVSFEGCTVLDVGASTGGFTDCALQHGAVSSTCVDVGRAQLHGRLLSDARVTNLERINARHLKPGDLPLAHYDRIVIDVSFISLTRVLPSVWAFLAEGGTLVALVKPQFEAGKEEVSRGRGVIRDDAVRRRVLDDVRRFVAANLPGARERGVVDSPIAGADGNREYLLVVDRVAGEG